ncbi:hypothetical protein J5N97_021439 [Dioscorea zingiberensis]|uniref:Uncharacterized protein n=1 Tax=Dioscorea zingiberensis TaxID=325984 RepID=A0A9D5CJV9_9LILI|nr:hypothetical protein J5N97_021439 [Dioscorea zingiberensis]
MTSRAASDMGMIGGSPDDRRKHRKLLPTTTTTTNGNPHPDPESFARSYQLEALEMAMNQNTIAFLETGAGKTLIAIMLIRAHAHMLRKPSDFIAVFLVPTVVLVDQQADVIQMHTNMKVGRFYGEMGVDFWSSATWKEKLELFEVFVMTPQILLDNLRHRFFLLEKIKLIIFDECHHARGNHPYACIMKEFYHCQLKSGSVGLPRIFGMTASLIYSKVSDSASSYRKQILQLENLMNSKVYTVENASVLSQYIPFSTPKIKLYKDLDVSVDLLNKLAYHLERLKKEHVQALQELEPDHLVVENGSKKISLAYEAILYCLRELGLCLAAKAAEYLSFEENHNPFWGQPKGGREIILRKFCQDVFQFLTKHLPTGDSIGDDLKADVDCGFLTPKVCLLIQCLLDYRKVKGLRCIIFVERVITAIVLQTLLSQITELSEWGMEYMAGIRPGRQTQSRKEQIEILDAFQGGKANVIVATQILEEGLDVQRCNLVIRFDPATTVCSFIQSRGRARMPGSDYLLFMKSDDLCALSKIKNYLDSGDVMRKESQLIAFHPCQPLDNGMCDEEYYRVDSTGAIVTLSSSVSLIYFYCSHLPSDRYYKPSPSFHVDKVFNTCTLNLPKSAAIPIVKVNARPKVLKQLACLEACRRLHEIGALTDYLLPVFDVEDGYLEREAYSYCSEQIKYFPGEFVDSWPSFSAHGLYHCYRIVLNQCFDYVTSFSDVFLVVRSYLGPDFDSYSFSLETVRGSIAVTLEYEEAIHLSFQQVLMAKRFQVSVLGILIHHDVGKFVSALNNLHQNDNCATVAYLLLPSNGRKIDWVCINSATFSMEKIGDHSTRFCSSCQRAHWLQIKDGSLCSCIIRNSIVYTPHSGRFYYITGILDKLNANSTMKDKAVLTYKEYFYSRHGIRLMWENQPLLTGRSLFTVKNCLLRHSFYSDKGSTNTGVELPPELCVVIMPFVPMNTLYSFSIIPSVMHRIECILLAARLKIELGHCTKNVMVPVAMVLEAITTKKCQEEFSLESLEMLGDSFLKYATCLHLFKSYKHQHEGILSAKKDKIVSNVSLCQLGCNRNLPGFIRVDQFNPEQWYIPGDCYDDFQVPQVVVSSSKDLYHMGTRHIKSKVVADCVEALIGACLHAGGEMVAFGLLRWLGMEIDFNKQITVESSIVARPEDYVNIKALEKLLQYTFRNPSLLVEALTHASYQVPDIPSCYQRLEFLGDAVLDHLITAHLYKKYPGLTPGLLTDLRSAAANNDCYAHAAAKAGLNKHILQASPELHEHMTFYLRNYAQSFTGSSYGWEAGIALPKVLGDVIESLAGAVFVDSGFDKATVWKSIRPLLEPLVCPETMEYHPVRELNDLCARKSYTKKFTLTAQGQVAFMTVEVVTNGTTYKASSTGPNKKIAKKKAAKQVLETLKASIPGLKG